MQPNIAQVTASKSSGRDDSLAVSEYDHFISKRATDYLQILAQEIGSTYLDRNDPYNVLNATQSQPSLHYEWS